MVAFVAVTVAVPDTVKTLEGESIENVPVVLTLTPVKFSLSLMDHVTGVMATWRTVLCDRPPLVPVTLTLYKPEASVLEGATVRTELQEHPAVGVTELGVKKTVSPEGVVVAERLMTLENPPKLLRMMLDVPWDPRATAKSTGVDAIEKSDETSGWTMRCPPGLTIVAFVTVDLPFDRVKLGVATISAMSRIVSRRIV